MRTRYQVTIPEEVRRKLGLEVGDYVEVEAQGNKIVIIPKKLGDKEEAWFWNKEWQEKESEADKAIGEGRVKGPFKTVEDLIESLES